MDLNENGVVCTYFGMLVRLHRYHRPHGRPSFGDYRMSVQCLLPCTSYKTIPALTEEIKQQEERHELPN